MATRLTKKQQTQLTEKLAGIIQKNNALQLRLSMDKSVNEMNVNQISGALNRIHGQAIGKDLPTVVTIPVKQLGSGDPSPDNIRPIVGYEIDGIGTVYGGELNIETGILTKTYGYAYLGDMSWSSGTSGDIVYFSSGTYANLIAAPATSTQLADIYCTEYKTGPSSGLILSGDKAIARNAVAGASGRVYVYDSSYTDATLFKKAVQDVLMVYRLTTPETYTLTPQQMLQLLDQL